MYLKKTICWADKVWGTHKTTGRREHSRAASSPETSAGAKARVFSKFKGTAEAVP